MKKKPLAEWQQDVIDQIEILSERDDQKMDEIIRLKADLVLLTRAVEGLEKKRAAGYAELARAIKMVGARR